MQIRRATADDAEAVCAVLIASITTLCEADHRNDPAFLQSWLSNKTPENVKNWITNPAQHFLVAVERGAIAGAAAVTEHGHVTLNYVAPESRFRGVSKTLLEALEKWVEEKGHARCTLSSTKTARAFYLSRGYEDDVTAPEAQGIAASGMPMAKSFLRHI